MNNPEIDFHNYAELEIQLKDGKSLNCKKKKLSSSPSPSSVFSDVDNIKCNDDPTVTPEEILELLEKVPIHDWLNAFLGNGADLKQQSLFSNRETIEHCLSTYQNKILPGLGGGGCHFNGKFEVAYDLWQNIRSDDQFIKEIKNNDKIMEETKLLDNISKLEYCAAFLHGFLQLNWETDDILLEATDSYYNSIFSTGRILQCSNLAQPIIEVLIILSNYYIQKGQAHQAMKCATQAHSIELVHRKMIPKVTLFKLYTLLMKLVSTSEDDFMYWYKKTEDLGKEAATLGNLIGRTITFACAYIVNNLPYKDIQDLCYPDWTQRHWNKVNELIEDIKNTEAVLMSSDISEDERSQYLFALFVSKASSYCWIDASQSLMYCKMAIKKVEELVITNTTGEFFSFSVAGPITIILQILKAHFHMSLFNQGIELLEGFGLAFPLVRSVLGATKSLFKSTSPDVTIISN